LLTSNDTPAEEKLLTSNKTVQAAVQQQHIADQQWLQIMNTMYIYYITVLQSVLRCLARMLALIASHAFPFLGSKHHPQNDNVNAKIRCSAGQH
jgi:hypothetical protein